MAKLTGPLLSFGARGQIGKAMVTANWRGIDYARQYVIPANPRTTAQQANRGRFALLREMYKLSPAVLIAPWTAFATGRPFLPVNKYVGENNRLLNGEVDMQAFIGSPGARGGLPPQSVTASDSGLGDSIDVDFVLPAQLPDGWAVNSVAAAAFPDQDPTTGIFTGPLVAGSEDAPATQVVLGGLPTVSCVVVGWIVYDKPDGSLAYSVSLGDTATPS